MHIILNAAMSIDGKIATRNGCSSFSSIEDLRRVHRLRSNVDGIVVGISTVLMDDPMLDVRFFKKDRKNPVRIILDSNARISLRSKIMCTSNRIPTILVVTNSASKKRIKDIEKTGTEVLISGYKSVNIMNVFHFLEKKGFKKILVEGGGEVNWSFLKLGVVNELIVTICPFIIGGRDAKTLVEGNGFAKTVESIKMRLNKVKHNQDEVVLFYHSTD